VLLTKNCCAKSCKAVKAEKQTIGDFLVVRLPALICQVGCIKTIYGLALKKESARAILLLAFLFSKNRLQSAIARSEIVLHQTELYEKL
jgi:hypothetical protein